MVLTRREVEHIAVLARLELTEEEKQRYAEQLSAILDYAARLQAVDTQEIPPTSSVLPPQTALRQDQARPGLTPEDLFHNAPDIQNAQFKVPPVLD